jgi:hypothetical protein
MLLKVTLGLLLFCVSVLAVPDSTHAQVDPNLRNRLQQSGAIIVNRHSVSLFNQIPDLYLSRARNIRMMWGDRSVGGNISEGLSCLTASSWSTSSAACRRDYYEITPPTWYWKTYSATDFQNGLVPSRILFPADPVTYNRSNWVFYFDPGLGVTPELSCSSSAQPWVGCFIEHVRNNSGSFDVFSYQHSYLTIMSGSDILGYFQNNSNRADIYNYAQLETEFPTKAFFYWTTSLARSLGSYEGQQYGILMRQFVTQNRKILFDVADILSYTDTGQPCYDNRDGVQYCTPAGNCENHPNDGHNYPAICQDFTSELEGGHLGSVSGGKILLAKAYWVLMAQIAGWVPGTSTPTPTTGPSPTPSRTPTPQPSPTRTPTPQPSPTRTPTPQPSPTPINYSLDNDNDIDIYDILILISRFTQNLVGDFNQNGRIDIFDFNTLLKNRL